MRFLMLLVLLSACMRDDSDSIQQEAQEKILSEGNSQIGMPGIHNFRERKIVKQILEMRDQADLTTTTYLVAEQTGQLIFLCHSIGYGVNAASQFTSPEKTVRVSGRSLVVPQADPNGLFSPSSAEGTWVLCKDPGSADVKPVYVEPRIVVSPFELRAKPDKAEK
jgi:hypothetical protein